MSNMNQYKQSLIEAIDIAIKSSPAANFEEDNFEAGVQEGLYQARMIIQMSNTM